jgi:hypothetical protein
MLANANHSSLSEIDAVVINQAAMGGLGQLNALA